MGQLKVKKLHSGTEQVTYFNHLVNDIQALELMLERNMIEKGPIRIGAEQELCLVDANWHPSDQAAEVLGALEDHHFTSELAKYNLEINLPPEILRGDCFSQQYQRLRKLLQKAGEKAAARGLKIILTGILPTISQPYLERSYMTPELRYQLLDEAVAAMRQEAIELHIKGVDELNLRHDSVMFEGCNTSFQLHLQIDPDDFAHSYNWAQAIAGPVLAAAVNSPLLLGKELWAETRIALFTQSVDTRASSFVLNERESRVGFGNQWVRGNAADFFKQSVIRFRSILTTDLLTDHSLREVAAGKVPELKALNLHNGTVYKWNRLCYGHSGEKAHLRIENRYLPAGPSLPDQIANWMFWTGLMAGRTAEYENLFLKWKFSDVKQNFFHAARYGMAAQFYWNGKLVPARTLLLDVLLPMAFRGLYKMKVRPEDAEHYMGLLEQRIRNRTGARWMTETFRELREHFHPSEAVVRLTEAIYAHQQKEYAVAAWELPRVHREREVAEAPKVADRMSTRILTAQVGDSEELVRYIMEWHGVHHVPILDGQGRLSGILSWTDLEAQLKDPFAIRVPIRDIMQREVRSIRPGASLEEAANLMKAHEIHSLPVLRKHKLVGILTATDLGL